jgi:hypothetical protein
MARKVRHGLMATAGAIGALALALALPTAASAAVHTGTLGCGAKFGWVTATTTGSTQITPPGSSWTYIYSTGGTRSEVAMTANQMPKTGGGYWQVYASINASGSPYCSAFG